MKAMNEQTSAAVEEVRLTNCEFLTVQQVATIAVEDFIREMDAGLIEYDTVTKKATRHRAKAKSVAKPLFAKLRRRRKFPSPLFICSTCLFLSYFCHDFCATLKLIHGEVEVGLDFTLCFAQHNKEDRQ